MYGRELSLISLKIYWCVCVCDICKLNDTGEYLRIISECDLMCPLEFWKNGKIICQAQRKLPKNIKVFKPALLLANVCLAQQEMIFSLYTEECQYYYLLI